MGLKNSVAYVAFHNFAMIKIDSFDPLSLEITCYNTH